MPGLESCKLGTKMYAQAGHRRLVLVNDEVYKQQEKYNNITKQQREQVGMERAVFPKFFTKPQVLVAQANALEGKPAKKTPARTPTARRSVGM